MTHDLSEYDSITIADRIFDLEDGAPECACLPGTERCELDDVDTLFNELDARAYGTDIP